ncbi:aromatic amino acid transaminase [Paenarthrobacter nicotinovorans]|uniref:aromatic amino acid transaminase n=1 Tax=Paenarthrobacter nicotinovorans TaxID=29320 RepID=UPI003800CD8C
MKSRNRQPQSRPSRPVPQTSNSRRAVLSQLPVPVPDSLWAIAHACRNDPRPNRLDLVIGVYRDDHGVTPVMGSVAEAERRLAMRSASKSYVGFSGDPVFSAEISSLILGDTGEGRTTAVQAVGGTGALHILARMAVLSRPDARIWVGSPTYVNHEQLFRTAGLQVQTFPFLDAAQRPSTQAVLDAVAQARRGDLLLIQGCCHNPTGTEMEPADWEAITEAAQKAGVVPFIDVAYYGLGQGLEKDLAGLRYLTQRVPEAFVAVSGAKAFGLYNDRVGAALVLSDAEDVARVRGTLEGIARAEYSQPPHHGAAIVAEILGDPSLREEWAKELEAMRVRLNTLRSMFLDNLDPKVQQRPEWQALRKHFGMFTTLPLEPWQMQKLREDFAIYGTDGGRINIAGLPTLRAKELAEAVSVVALAQETKAKAS